MIEEGKMMILIRTLCYITFMVSQSSALVSSVSNQQQQQGGGEADQSSWDQWWTYDGISGVEFWGLLNPKWSHCNKGRRQSPLDINPDLLLFDPTLTPFNIINANHVKGQMMNTGRGIKFIVSANTSVILNGGPLSYDYTLSHILIHYGREDDRGSEHTINGFPFPGEIQLYFYNSQLYHNWTEAADQPNGLAAIGVLVQLASKTSSFQSTSASSSASSSSSSSSPGNSHNLNSHSRKGSTFEINPQLKSLLNLVETVKFKGLSSKVHKLQLDQLLPSSDQYITYEGSLTEPACYETVQWIIINKPIYVSSNDLNILRNMVQLEGSHGDNFRPLQPTNYRSLRTNIVFKHQSTNYQSSTNYDNKKHISNKYNNVSSSNSGHHRKTTTISSSISSSKSISEINFDNESSNNNRIKFCSGRGYVTYKANVGRGGFNEMSMEMNDPMALSGQKQDSTSSSLYHN